MEFNKNYNLQIKEKMDLHPHEIEILKVLKKRYHSYVDDILKEASLESDAVYRAISWLSSKGLVETREEISFIVSLGNEGLSYAMEGLPERQILNFMKGREKAPIKEIREKFGNQIANIGIGWLVRKGLAKVRNSELIILNDEKSDDEKLLEKIWEKGEIAVEELNEREKSALDQLKSRKNVINLLERKRIFVELTEKGKSLPDDVLARKIEEISQLTPSLLRSGEWKKKKFRRYDVQTYVKPTYPGKKHPLQRAIDEIRCIFVEMGFKEISGPLIESAFWNFDALFQPQDHPARDMHDTFYLETPKSIEIPYFDEFKEKVKRTHENGWGYCWSEEIARKTLLRTHTTAVTCRYLAELKPEDLPAKVFCIGKTFRNETVDYKHLPEFYQVEGIVVAKDVNFRHLLGILKEFYDRMGFEVRFRPAYFPYTEMSVEPEVFIEERNEWIELGGAGIFRPEVVVPLLGFECPVLAWGLGLDRVVALKLGLTDIRDLYISDLKWLRESSII